MATKLIKLQADLKEYVAALAEIDADLAVAENYRAYVDPYPPKFMIGSSVWRHVTDRRVKMVAVIASLNKQISDLVEKKDMILNLSIDSKLNMILERLYPELFE